MGWSYGHSGGREVGYAVDALCDEPGCLELIDRGLAYCCGGMHGDNCGGYFCSEHLFLGDAPHFTCARCLVEEPE